METLIGLFLLALVFALFGSTRALKQMTIIALGLLGIVLLQFAVLALASLGTSSPPASARQAQESLADYAERRNAEMTLESLRARFRSTAVP